jgi:type IV pilus assembly protein PilX
MQHTPTLTRSRQHGIVLIASLLMLVIVTIMALSIFRSFGIQEKIAGNMREKQRSMQAAVSTEQYAEWWLANKSNAPVAVSAYAASSVDVTCNILMDANVGNTQICVNSLASVGVIPTAVPWTTTGGAVVGVAYTPPNMNINGTACSTNCSAVDFYFARPAFYVADMGQFGRMGELYQVDAYSYGVSPSTLTVVESTVAVSCIVCNPGTI